jgi:hypothetical protein
MSANELHFALEKNRWWTTNVCLPSWKGFQNRTGAYGALDEPIVSDGFTKIVFAPEGRGNDPLSDLEIASVRWVIENEGIIGRSLLDSLLSAYSELQVKYRLEGIEKIELMPDIASRDDFRPLIGLTAVNVHQVQKDGLPYAGFEFGCRWDDEHGLGVLMHGARAVQIGMADTAILLWIAEEDGGAPLGA